MNPLAFAGRGFAATLLTGLGTSLLFAAGIGAMGVLHSSGRSLTGLAEFISFFWFMGTFVTLPCAMVGGLCVEWPKSRWLMKRPSGGWWPSLLISLLGAEVLLLSFVFITSAR